MKKNLTKKLMLSVLTLAFAVVSLGASTFAWFTIGGTQQEASFEASVKGGEGLDIAVTQAGATPTEWYAAGSLPEGYIEDIIVKQNKDDAAWKFDAVTPTAALVPGANSFQKIKWNEPVEDDESTPEVETAAGYYSYDSADKGYVLFDIHFQLSDKTTSTAYDLYMETLELKSSNVNAWTCDLEYNLSASDKVEQGSQNFINILAATRIAVINKTTTEYSSVFQQSAKSVALAADNGYNTVGVDKTYGAADYYQDKTQRPFDTTIDPVERANATINWTEADTLALYETAVQQDFAGTQVVTLTIAVWIEGWDAECLNALFSQKLSVYFEFGLRNSNGQKLS